MSVGVMTLVWAKFPNSDASVTLIMLALADWSSDAGLSWPSIPTLARKARMSERNARYILRKLETDNFITIIEQRGRNRSNRYQINLQRLQVLPDYQPKTENLQPGVAKTCKAAHGKPAKPPSKTCNPASLKPAIAIAAEPSIDPSTLRTVNEPSHTHHARAREAAPPTAPERVCVNKSKFTTRERRAYADNQSKISNKEGWLISSEDGRFDAVIEAWQSEQGQIHAPPPSRDVSLCPDCHGSGWLYPNGVTNGAKKCRHEKLAA
jgi:hypothetical protein